MELAPVEAEAAPLNALGDRPGNRLQLVDLALQGQGNGPTIRELVHRHPGEADRRGGPLRRLFLQGLGDPDDITHGDVPETGYRKAQPADGDEVERRHG